MNVVRILMVVSSNVLTLLDHFLVAALMDTRLILMDEHAVVV